jgi:hypothetical protein
LKLYVHDIFTTGILAEIGCHIYNKDSVLLAVAFLLSFLGNHLIDKIGHSKNRQGWFIRNRLGHTITGATIIGFIPALLIFIFYFYIFHQIQYWILFLGLFVGILHLSLDIITEKGIYIGKKRFALAHFSYNNYLVNSFFALIGVALIFIVLINGNFYNMQKSYYHHKNYYHRVYY